ncbi:MAG: fluoride efflux transporter CrcB [Pseudomonadota bacterium]
MNHLLLVALGGAIGASMRHLTGLAALRYFGPGFPMGTLIVNISGSLMMGLLIAALSKGTGFSNEVRLFVATGILGGFTTFSAFSLDVANMIERGAMGPAFAYVLASIALSILAVFAGLWIGRAIL